MCHIVPSVGREALVVSLTKSECRDLCRSLRQSLIITTIREEAQEAGSDLDESRRPIGR